MSNLDKALEYAEMGYAVFPCNELKRPRTANGLLDATTNEDQIRVWWEMWPEANIAISTAGLLVVDVDPVKEGGENTWPNDGEKAMDLATGPLAYTPRGGRHHVFRQPDGANYRNSAGRIAESVDVRANGGYILVAPSATEDGEYRWIQEIEPAHRIPLPPGWLTDMLAAEPTTKAILNGENIIPDGQRNDTLIRIAGSMRRIGMSNDEIESALMTVNQNRCNPPLPDAEVMRVAHSAVRYEPDQFATALVEGHYDQDRGETTAEVPPKMGEEKLYIPGFIGEMVDHCLETAPRPNQAMAFSAALAMQSFLVGRKVRDESDIRPNIYILGLDYSGAGKDAGISLNSRLAFEVGFQDHLAADIASGEGLEDRMKAQNAILLQTDEINTMLQAIASGKEHRHQTIMKMLLSMYSRAKDTYYCRIKADGKGGEAIYNPHLTLFGTAVPKYYYEAMSEAMLSNGLISRMIIVEGGTHNDVRKARIQPIPERVLDVARHWAQYASGSGNLAMHYPNPTVIEYTPKADAMMDEEIQRIEQLRKQAIEAQDEARNAVLSRQIENTRKLALLYAVSDRPKKPRIGPECVEWSRGFMQSQVDRMLHQAGNYVSSSPFHESVLKVRRILETAPTRSLPHWKVSGRLPMKPYEFDAIIQYMGDSGQISIETAATGGRPKRVYTLIR
jgi:hypothetical protein